MLPHLVLALAVVTACTDGSPVSEPAPAADAINLDVIWVSYDGTSRESSPFHQPPGLRSRDEARELIDGARRQLELAPARFPVVARDISDDVYSRQNGGAMGMTTVREMPRELADAAAALPIDRVSPVIDTPHGFYLLRRRADAANVRVSAASIFVTWTGAESMIAPVTPRSHAQARELAETARRAAMADPDHFAAAVRRFTDDRDRVDQDGWEGVWSSVATPLEGFPHITQAVLALGIGEVSPVIESIDGFYVLRRLPLVEPPVFAATEIVVAYAGARFSDSAVRPVLRTRDQARALATKLADQLRAEPARFDRAVTESSDVSTSKTGGKRTWTKGRSLPALDAAIERTGVGDIVGPVETPLGFSILRRDFAP